MRAASENRPPPPEEEEVVQDVPASHPISRHRPRSVGPCQGDDGDRRPRRRAECPRGAHLALHQDAQGDPGRAGGRVVPEGRREFHPPPAPGLQGGGGLGDDREADRLRPGGGVDRGGAG